MIGSGIPSSAHELSARGAKIHVPPATWRRSDQELRNRWVRWRQRRIDIDASRSIDTAGAGAAAHDQEFRRAIGRPFQRLATYHHPGIASLKPKFVRRLPEPDRPGENEYELIAAQD